MRLTLRGHDDRYAIEQSLLAFFPEERPVYGSVDRAADRRYAVMSRVGVRQFSGFNEKVLEAEARGTPIRDPMARRATATRR